MPSFVNGIAKLQKKSIQANAQTAKIRLSHARKPKIKGLFLQYQAHQALGVRVTMGTSISCREMPPCWNVPV